MKPETRAYLLNVLIASVPDFVICWIAMRLTDTDWAGFVLAFLALQAIYLFFWFKTALWSWLTFWLYRKKRLAAYLENYFIDNHFPVPSEYTNDLDDYLGEIYNDKTADTAVRLKAAHELGTLNGFRVVHKMSLVLQICSAGAVAIKRYARLANRFAAGQSMTPEDSYE